MTQPNRWSFPNIAALFCCRRRNYPYWMSLGLLSWILWWTAKELAKVTRRLAQKQIQGIKCSLMFCCRWPNTMVRHILSRGLQLDQFFLGSMCLLGGCMTKLWEFLISKVDIYRWSLIRHSIDFYRRKWMNLVHSLIVLSWQWRHSLVRVLEYAKSWKTLDLTHIV